jgi:SMODS and SLOG-associating 2TM effector domain 3/SMODS and SLOG-associating 2TM effector domain 1
MSTAEQGLTDADLPGLFEAADAASLEGQRQHVRTVRFRLVLAVVAAFTGVFSWRVGGRIDLAAIGTALALVAISLTELNVKSFRPADRWYDGRALAESAKSLAWRYSVGGVPFTRADDEGAVKRRFIRQMAHLLEEAPTTSIKPSQRPVITEQMAALRASDLATRKAAYLSARIGDQQEWYSRKADFNEKLAARWRTTLVVIEVLGIAAALAKAVSFVTLDLAGIIAAVIAAGTAWMSLRQYSTLARAYTFAAHELAIARGRLELVVDEGSWAEEVADSEEAVSREHTMWRASRSRASN